MFVEFKQGEKHASTGADQSEYHESFNDCGYLLKNDEIVIDIDNLPKRTIEKMIETFNIKTQIVHTSRGIHLYYKLPKGHKNKTQFNCPLGFKIESFTVKQRPNGVTIKRDGVLRTIDNAGVREELPDFFKGRINGLDDLNGLGNEDGRNNKLYNQKFKIMSVTDYKKILRFINEYVFAEPLEEDEFQTVARDEQLRAEKDNEAEVAKILINKLKVIKFSNTLFVHTDGGYMNDGDGGFTNIVTKHLFGQKTRYIDEVMKQMNYQIENVKEPERGWDIKFKNGILRDGLWIAVETNEFSPFHVDIEYNEDAEPVEAVDDYLNFLTDGEPEYRQVILECMAHTLITNPEFKRQLAKFFVFIGDGGNGKGTALTILRRILGRKNCASLSPADMTKEQYFTSLQGKLANLGDDIEDKAIDEKQMKALKNISTCDYISSRELYKQSKEVVVTTSLIFTSNHLLKSFEKGESYKRRVIWMPMFGKVTKKDPKIISKLTAPDALEYWVKLMVEAYFGLYENETFTESPKLEEYNKSYHEENNGTLMFVRDHKAEDFINMKSPEVHDLYERFASENGLTVQSKKILNETLESELGVKLISTKVDGRSARVYRIVNATKTT